MSRRPHLLAVIGLSATLLALTVAPPAAGQTISNPRLYEKTFEAAFGALRAFGAHEDLAELRRVTRIAFQLVEVSAYRDYPFTFHLIEMPVPNAFALPGGQIFLTRGMLAMDLTDDELAGLLGHEIAHVIEQHGVRTQKKARLLNVLGQALVIGVLANEVTKDRRDTRSGTYYDPYANSGGDSASRVQGAAAASLVTSELLLRSYSREFEDEADATGQRLAALAGYDPQGTASLMNKMSVQIPQTKEYGYWLTHPFFDQRVQHAEVRRANLTIAPSRPDPARIRADTQSTLLAWAREQKLEPEQLDYARTVALHTWPIGDAADEIRLGKLHQARDAEAELALLAQNFSALIDTYEREIEDLKRLSEGSPLIAILERELIEFASRRAELFPQAEQIVAKGIYETGFLETFLANYPEAPQASRLALELGEAYSRLSRHGEAVERFLTAWRSAPDSEVGQRAHRGLTVLASRLKDLEALERLAGESDPQIAEPASARLAELAPRFTEVEAGAKYLDAFPEGRHNAVVSARLNALADDLYGEVVLYQTVGDAAKAVTGIQRILNYAPFSPAADRLRQQMILES